MFSPGADLSIDVYLPPARRIVQRDDTVNQKRRATSEAFFDYRRLTRIRRRDSRALYGDTQIAYLPRGRVIMRGERTQCGVTDGVTKRRA